LAHNLQDSILPGSSNNLFFMSCIHGWYYHQQRIDAQNHHGLQTSSLQMVITFLSFETSSHSPADASVFDNNMCPPDTTMRFWLKPKKMFSCSFSDLSIFHGFDKPLTVPPRHHHEVPQSLISQGQGLQLPAQPHQAKSTLQA
jgi:hypothetical protein